MHQQVDSQLRRYLHFLKRQAWVVILVPALALAFAAAVTFSERPVYRATMKMVVAQGGGDFQPQLGDQQLSQTIKALLESDIVGRQVIRDLNLDTTTPKLRKRLNVSFRPDSAVLDVSYDSPSRAQALTILSRISKVFSSLVDKRLGVRSGRSVFGSKNPLPVIVVSEFDPPHLEPEAVSPKPVKTLGFVGAFGLALGLVLAFARESLDDRLRSRKDAEDWFGAPVVGTLPKRSGSDRGVGLGLGEARGRDASLIQALQLLRANLQFSQAGIAGPALLITSATSHEGKTTVAGSLAASLALGGNRVICIEGDLRKPNLNRFLGVEPNAHGLVDVMEGDVAVEQAVQIIELGLSPNGNSSRAATNGTSTNGATATPRGTLHLLPSGRLPLDPATILTPERVSDLIGRLSSDYDYVIIDGPPLGVPDAFPLALAADDVLVVARRGRTIRQTAERVRTVLQRLGVESVGVVLTNAPPSETRAYA